MAKSPYHAHMTADLHLKNNNPGDVRRDCCVSVESVQMMPAGIRMISRIATRAHSVIRKAFLFFGSRSGT